MLSRRSLLGLGVASCLTKALTGCYSLKSLQPDCPVDWAPSLLGTVFYGYTDFSECGCPGCASCLVLEARGVSGTRPPAVGDQSRPAMRVYYPTLDGAPNGAAILDRCERFPLVLFVHGDCGGDPYLQWDILPAQLARCGYVVAVTQWGGILSVGDPATTAPLHQAEQWLRNAWAHGDRLLPAPHTAVVGHSYGATLGAQLVTEMPVMAFASLSGTFGQVYFESAQKMLSAIQVPSLFCWNDNDDVGFNAKLLMPDVPDDRQLWAAIGTPKHGVIFQGGLHGDYLRPGTAVTCAQNGPCARVPSLAADFVTTFLGKYVPPEYDFSAFTWVPNSLFVRPQSLPAPPANGFYASDFLIGFAASAESASPPLKACVEEVLWQTSWTTGTTFVASA